MSFLPSSSQSRFTQHHTSDSADQARQGQQQRPPHNPENTPTPPLLHQPARPPSSPLDAGWVFDESNGPSVLPHQEATLLESLRYQLNQIESPLNNQLDAIVHFFDSLKKSEKDLKRILSTYPTAPALKQLQGRLSVFLVDFNTALQLQASRPQLGPIHFTHEQIQTVCQGLAVCAPPTRGLLFNKQHATSTALQGLTDTLLTRAMALGLPEALQANGEVLDILNWLSRGLKAGVLAASEPIDRCFEKSLVLIADWTGGDQCHQLLTDHNLGRCAVQLSTLIKHTRIDLLAPSPNDLRNEESPTTKEAPTNGELLQNSILNLCSPAVLKRLIAAPVDTVSLLNVCNTVKDAIDKKVLAAHDPLLLPALEQLVKAISGLPESELIGTDSDCRPLANFSNFLRELAEHEVNHKQVFQAALSMLDPACKKLIDCINSDAFKDAYPDSQALSNLISFVKLCDKRLALKNETSTASATTTSSTTYTSSPEQSELIHAGTRLTAGVVEYEASYFSHPAALSGLLAGLAYLWQRNLVPLTPAMRALTLDLLNQIAHTKNGTWNVQSKKVVLPALRGLLQLEVITYETDAAQSALRHLLPASVSRTGLITLKHISNENKRLGAIEEVVTALPMAVHDVAHKKESTSTATTTTTTTNTTAAINDTASKIIPGLTALRTDPPLFTNLNSKPKRKDSSLLGSHASSSSSTSNSMAAKPFQEPKKTARHTTKAFNHSPPIVINRTPTVQELANKEREKNEALKKTEEKKATEKRAREKNQYAKKQAIPARAGKSAPAKGQNMLGQAILNGQANLVTQQFRQQTTWSDKEIVAVLDAVMGGIELIDTGIVEALDVFITAVKAARNEAGTVVLTDYFKKNPSGYAGVQALLVNHNLLAVKVEPKKSEDFRLKINRAKTPEQLLALLDSLTETDWNNHEITESLSKRLDLLPAMGAFLFNYSSASENRSQTMAKLLKLPIGEKLALKKDEYGHNLLQTTIKIDKLDVAGILLGMPSAAVQAAAVDKYGMNALMFAAHLGHMNIVERLLAMPSAAMYAASKTKDGWNALMLAASKGHSDCVECLLAMPSAALQAAALNKNGGNALMFAADLGHTGIVKRLLAMPSAAMQAAAKTKDGTNALMLAAEKGHIHIVEHLLAMPSAAAQAAEANKEGANALLLAADQGHTGIVDCLLAMPSAAMQAAVATKDGWNALMLAAEKGHVHIVKHLLAMPSAAAQAAAANKEGMNALMLAAHEDHAGVVELLLSMPSADAQAAAANKYGVNALMHAAQEGRKDIVERLLAMPSAAAQANAVDKDGQNALQIAKKYGFDAIVTLLTPYAVI